MIDTISFQSGFVLGSILTGIAIMYIVYKTKF